MSSIELNDIPSGYNLNKINDNFGRIETVINEQLLHRVNSDDTPNSVETDIDMNGQHLYNLPKPVLGSSPLRLKDLFGDPDELLQGPDTEHITATAGQTVFNLSSNYVVGTNSLLVFRDGVYQRSPSQYTESSTTSITFTTGIPVGTVISVVPVAVSGGGGGGGTDVTGAANLGAGSGVFSNRTGNSLMFKSLKAGSGVTITDTPTEVQIASSAATSTASNIGTTGEGVFASKVGNDFQFKKLRAGTNVTLTSDSTGVVINSSGGGGGGSPVAVYDNSVLKTSGATSLNFVNATVSSSSNDITVQVPAEAYISVKDYGATGDGVTDDSSNIQAAITAAQLSNRTLFFPDGTYVISSLGVQSGRLIMLGTGNSTLKGTFKHTGTYATSADTVTPLTPTSVFFSANGFNFQSVTAGTYGLELVAQPQPNFLSTFSILNCKFFGPNGLYCRNGIGFEVLHCEFNNVLIGSKFEGCNNGLFVANRWQNQAHTGTLITYAGDHGAGGVDRKGGENLKFVNCEWAVCSTGMYVEMAMWLVIESSLFDYCGVPLHLRGTDWVKLDKTYFGASDTPVARFSGISGYQAPATSGIALYGTAGGYTVGENPVGVTAHNCEFVNYTVGVTQPLVYLEGYVNGTYPASLNYATFTDNLFLASVNHNSTELLQISNGGVARVISNRFLSFNKSSTMTEAYRTYQILDYQNHSNSFLNCTQSGVMVRSSYESAAGLVIDSSTPTQVYPGLIWVQP